MDVTIHRHTLTHRYLQFPFRKLHHYRLLDHTKVFFSNQQLLFKYEEAYCLRFALCQCEDLRRKQRLVNKVAFSVINLRRSMRDGNIIFVTVSVECGGKIRQEAQLLPRTPRDALHHAHWKRLNVECHRPTPRGVYVGYRRGA